MSKKKFGLDKEHDLVELEEQVPSKNGSSDPMYDQEDKKARRKSGLRDLYCEKEEKEKENERKWENGKPEKLKLTGAGFADEDN